MELRGTWMIATALAGAAALASPASRAQGLELRADPVVEVPVSILAGAVWLGGEGAKAKLGAATCRWCDRDAAGNDTLNVVDATVRDALRWNDTASADLWSNIAGFGVAPAAGFGGLALVELGDDAIDRFPADALMVGESAVFAGALNSVVKIAVARERPFVHALSPEEKLHTPHPDDNDVSFYSGHTSFTFALAAATGTVATLRGYRWAPALWATGMGVAAATGWLRIAADKHYFTDVVAGAVAGTAVGVAVPLLLHGRQPVPSSPASASTAASPLFVVTIPL